MLNWLKRLFQKQVPKDDEAIHSFFGLSYSSHLVVPRTVLQSMPARWQRDFVDHLLELDEAAFQLPIPNYYGVVARDTKGKFTGDPLADYGRGSRRVPLRPFTKRSHGR